MTRSSRSATVTPQNVTKQLDDIIDHGGGEGIIEFGRDKMLKVSSLNKVFFPKVKHTKGDLMRHYSTVAKLILPTLKDRPFVLKRFPNGVNGEAFYQQNASNDVPDGVRVEVIDPDGEPQRRYIGGDLLTLLYTIQLGAISVDPWHSRVTALHSADYSIIDLDPGPRAPFSRVVEVALMLKESLDEYGLTAAIKTSGATGLHVYIPIPLRTPTESATLVAQLIATDVATRHPKEATIARMVGKRGVSTVYVDYLQNIRGKTIAGAYAVRATPTATVSTPLRWNELTDKLDPRDFTIDTVPARFAKTGDLWNPVLKQRNSLKKVLDGHR